MKTVGLIGGMSWESTIPYYEIINEKIKEQLGGLVKQEDSVVPTYDTTLIHATKAAELALE